MLVAAAAQQICCQPLMKLGFSAARSLSHTQIERTRVCLQLEALPEFGVQS